MFFPFFLTILMPFLGYLNLRKGIPTIKKQKSEAFILFCL